MRTTFYLACLLALPAQAETITERHYADAMEALKKCEKAWFQSQREAALEVISDAGTFLATTLNPLARDYAQHSQMLEEVTSALRQCGKIAYPD